MKLAIIFFVAAFISFTVFGGEIESKILPSEKRSIVAPASGPIESLTVKSTTTEYYRNSKKVLEKRDLEETLKLKGKDAATTDRQVWIIFAKEREIIVIAHPDKRPYSVTSPWPIYIEHNQLNVKIMNSFGLTFVFQISISMKTSSFATVNSPLCSKGKNTLA